MKRVLTVIFIVVFLLTIFLGGWELTKPKGDDDDVLFREMDDLMVFIVIAPVLLLEFEIYNVCIYAFSTEKNKVRTIWKITSLVMALLVFGSLIAMVNFTTNKFQIVYLILWFLYILLKPLPLIFRKKQEK